MIGKERLGKISTSLKPSIYSRIAQTKCVMSSDQIGLKGTNMLGGKAGLYSEQY